MAYTVKINSVDKTSLVQARTVYVNLGSDHRDTCSFDVLTTAGSYLPRAGMPVLIEDSGTVFAGLIASAPQSKIGAVNGDSTDIMITVSAIGYYSIPYRRTASETYTSVDAGDIVSDLITTYLSTESITAGTITAGAALDAYDAYGKTIGAILDELAGLSGYQWYIDNSKALHFIQDTSISAAAHDLLESGVYTNFGDVRIDETLDMYRNRQIIQGGMQTDGTTLNYVAEDAAEIAARAAIEGGSGVHENVYTNTSVTNSVSAAAVALNLLKKYGRVALTIQFESRSTDWRPATKLKANLPSFGISSDRYFLIERVTYQDQGGGLLIAVVDGTSKNDSDFSTQTRDRYVDYFAKLLAGQRQSITYADSIAAVKTRTYYQDTQPSGGSYIPGDTWFDTDDDNRIYKWSGAAWVAVLFGENAIADLSITNAKIANLDAGKITSGYIAAARIDVDTLYIKKLWANSSVLNYLTYEPYYTWSGQTFAGTQYWTDDADASPSAVQHLLLLGDVSKADAESQTIITAVSLNSSGADLNYETNLKIGSMVPTQLGDGNYGYAEFIGNTSGGNGSAMLGAGNSDGSDYLNLNVFHNELNVWDETGELFEMTRTGGLKFLGSTVWHGGNDGAGSGLDADKLDGVHASGFLTIPVYIPGSVDLNDYTTPGMYYCSSNARAATLSNCPVVLAFSLLVEQHAGTKQTLTVFGDNNISTFVRNYYGSWGSWYQVWNSTGMAIDSDKLDGYHASSFLQLAGGTMTGNLAMGSNDITLSGNITGSTSDTWIQARRVGLGVAPNSNYTVDAGTTGYIRAGKYYAGSSGGVSNSYKLQDYNVGGYYTLTFTGGILTGSSWSST